MARVDINQTRKVNWSHQLTKRHVHKVSDLIAAGARRLVPRGDHRSGSGARRPGLSLAAALKVKQNSTVTTVSELIGMEKSYAASEHQGSEAHEIVGHGKKLKFKWERGTLLVARRGRRGKVRGSGGFFFFIRVRHPGNKRPVRFLTTPMHLYGRLYGFRTSSARVNRTRLP